MKTLLPAGLYLAITLWALRVILPSPTVNFPYRAFLDGKNWLKIEHSDQRFVAWNVTRNARLMLTHPTRLLDGSQQCHPTPNALTLGDHMLGEGLVGTLPWALTGDPVLTYNAVLVLTIWIAALSMYALVLHWTGSPLAAFVAGFLFAFHPTRLGDPSHPYVPGNHWTPLALLFAQRLFARRTWLDAGGLALFLSLQLLESFYMVLALLLVGGVYGGYLLVRHLRALPAVAPKLLVVGAAVAGVAALVFGPYLRTQAVWGTLSDRSTFFVVIDQFFPGGAYYPGTVAVVLAAVGLLDRLRGPRRTLGHDPRLAIAFGGVCIVWTVGWGLAVPVVRWEIPSLYNLLALVVPGLGAVRALAAVGIGLGLVFCVLAGYGVLALVERGRSGVARAVTAAIVLAAFAEMFHPGLATRSWGQPGTLKAWAVRPELAAIPLARRLDEGAVLDIPFQYDVVGLFRAMAYYVFWGAYHHQPLAACFNSFTPPVKEDVAALAGRLPAVGAADALHALGFRSIVLHEEFLFPADRGPWEEKLAGLVRAGRLAPLGRGGLDHVFYRLTSPTPVAASFAALVTGDGAEPRLEVAPGGEVAFVFRNAAAAVYRHPDPIQPTPLLIRWYAPSGQLVLAGEKRALLPLALAPGEEIVRPLAVPLPPRPGDYLVTLAPAPTPDLIVARGTVRLTP